MKEDVFSLDEGSVVLTWPERISKTSAQDLKDWLALVARKIERAAALAEHDRPSVEVHSMASDLVRPECLTHQPPAE